MASNQKWGWLWWIFPIVVFIVYRHVTGSSLTRDIGNGIESSVKPSSQDQQRQVKGKSQKQTWIDYYETGECQSNMLKKSKLDPRMVKIRKELGPDVDSAIKPAFDLYCGCVSTTAAGGGTTADVITACKPIIEREFRTRMWALGYDIK